MGSGLCWLGDCGSQSLYLRPQCPMLTGIPRLWDEVEVESVAPCPGTAWCVGGWRHVGNPPFNKGRSAEDTGGGLSKSLCSLPSWVGSRHGGREAWCSRQPVRRCLVCPTISPKGKEGASAAPAHRCSSSLCSLPLGREGLGPCARAGSCAPAGFSVDQPAAHTHLLCLLRGARGCGEASSLGSDLVRKLRHAAGFSEPWPPVSTRGC